MQNVLVDVAHIGREKISPLSQLKASGFNAVTFPGGVDVDENVFCLILFLI